MADFGRLVAMLEQIIANRDIHQEKIEANMIAWREVNKAYREETGACLEKMETYLERKEPIPVEMAKVALHPENSNGATWEEKARVTDD
jgi:hypothetical protein